MEFVCGNIGVGANGHLTFAGMDTAALAEQYGTPLYLMDEARLRHNCRVYLDAFQAHFSPDSLPCYASKANSFKELCRIVASEGMGLDVVSCGELRTALLSGCDMSRVFFHGNNKTDADIRYAMENGVGYFILDDVEELLAVSRIAREMNLTQKVQLRVTPGIDPHTYAAVDTGRVDSKFGIAIETGQADEAVKLLLQQPALELTGIHCHVGSQVFGEDVFQRAAAVMLDYIAHIRDITGYTVRQLNLGGGYGVPYTLSDGTVDIAARIGEVAQVIHRHSAELGIPEPAVLMEPGRSIVADAGMTLYTVGTVKNITGYKRYVSVDGGMADNPRYALYESRYTCLAANRITEAHDTVADVVGRCCESGDIIQPSVPLPASVCRGDILAVCTTGAYNYSMASNYNRLPRPPIVMLKDGASRIAVRRETPEDLTALDL